MRYKIGDKVIVVQCESVTRENVYVGRELTIEALGTNPNGNGYIFNIDGNVKFLWECEIIPNTPYYREDRLKKLLDIKKGE